MCSYDRLDLHPAECRPDYGAAISLFRGVVLGWREDLNNIMAIAILFLLYFAENFH